jgi:YD repeat-containing protein
MTEKTYSNTTPAVTYSYDAGTNGKGRLTQVAVAGGSTMAYNGFDAVGNVQSSARTTAGQTYAFGYRYDLAGNLKCETYPSGAGGDTTQYDAASRRRQCRQRQERDCASGLFV